MSNDKQSKDDSSAPRATDEKITSPPPVIYDEVLENDEHTVLQSVPEELLAESARDTVGKRPMFARDPTQVRNALPTEAEGDALLDMLFEEKEGKAAAPARPAPRRLPPPLPGKPEPVRDVSRAPSEVTLPMGTMAETPVATPGRDEETWENEATQLFRSSAHGDLPELVPDHDTVETSSRDGASGPSSRDLTTGPSSRDAAERTSGRDGATPPPLPTASSATRVLADLFGDDEEPEAELVPDSDAPEAELTPLLSPLSESGVPRPSRIPSRAPPASRAFRNERDAIAYLIEQQERDAWAGRAEWLRAEAQAIEDQTKRARALLAVSEIYCMAGEDPTARAVAAEVREIAPSSPLAHRQVRGLLARDGDDEGSAAALEAETRVAPTPAARCHGSWLAAEIARVRLGDHDTARKRVEQAVRTAPADPRGHIQRFVEELGDPEVSAAQLAKVRLPDATELAPLAEAFGQVGAHRGAASRGRAAVTGYEALLRARAALVQGDIPEAVTQLEQLGRSAGLTGGSSWLAGALAAPRRATRARAVEALGRVADGAHAAAARRAIATRAIELGDPASAASATASADSKAFSAADRVALAALTGGSRSDIEPWLEAASYDGNLAPISAATSAALTDPASPERRVIHVGGTRSRAAVALGRTLAANGGAADAAIDLMAGVALERDALHYADVAPDSGVAKALSLELDIEAGAGGKVARVIASWDVDGSEGERDRALAAGLLAEHSGEIERALVELDRARLADPTHEGAVRARAAHAETTAAARIVAEHAQSLGAGARAAILLSEAAIRLIQVEGADEAEPILRRTAEMDPKLPFAIHLGERSARARGDREALVDWLRARREASEDPIEQAHDLVREALLVSDGDGAPAALLLEQAMRARPEDVGLRELYERLSPEPPGDRVAWRAARAAEGTGPDAVRMALEAALELERTGDTQQAVVLARKAIEGGESLLAPICVYRCAIAGHGAGELIDALLPRARETSDPVERLEIYERLADLDELGRKDTASGLLWRRSILEETPTHLPTLRRMATALVSGSRDEELEPIALEIAKTLEGPESVAHATLSARLRLRVGSWDDTAEPVKISYKSTPRGVWTLRQMAAHARAQGNHALAVEVDRQLAERTERPSEIATLSLRAAEAAAKAGDREGTLELHARAASLVSGHLVAHLELAQVLEETGSYAAAAESYENTARASFVPEERVLHFHHAAVLWADKEHDAERARRDFESVAELNPNYADVFPRLQAIYVAAGARAELADLLKRRLDGMTDPDERVEMEVLRGRALAEVGDRETARRALAAALDASPDHVEALSAFAELSAAEEDWSGAEQAWIRLARLAPDPARQVEIYLRLGELYDEHLDNPERAELSYQEILKRSPADETARERLVKLYKRGGDAVRAIEQQTILITNAEAPEAKCRRTAELAAIYEATGDNKKAEATLLTARKTWPKDDVALAALARFYQRTEQGPAVNVLLDRAVADARRALATGRFEPFLFSTLATVAELRGRPDAAQIAQATVAALEGGQATMDGAGVLASDSRLDDVVAPEVLTPAFRELLQKTGPLLDTAVPFDLAAIRATPLPPHQRELGDMVQLLAEAAGLPSISVHVSTVLGAVCVPASSNPPTIVFGQALAASPKGDVRTFLVHRAIKVIQGNAGAFSRTAPIDLWPLLAAYLKAFSPHWTPQGVDAAKLTEAYGRLTRAMPARLDPQLGVLAADVIGTIGNRASTLNSAVNGWGNRTGLLALGDPNIALEGIAWASGQTNGPPAAGKDRVTWIGRNAEARELIVYSVSDGYADARARFNLGRKE